MKLQHATVGMWLIQRSHCSLLLQNDLRQLDALIQKWREVAQEAAETLLASSTLQPRPSMAQLMDYLHIDHTIIHYSNEDEAFY